MQRASQSAAAKAVNKLAARLATGSDRLARLVRNDQDLAAEADTLDKAIIAAVSKEPAERDGAAEQRIRDAAERSHKIRLPRSVGSMGRLLSITAPPLSVRKRYRRSLVSAALSLIRRSKTPLCLSWATPAPGERRLTIEHYPRVVLRQ
jgi:septal ring factor EnvC (AmiA/AmiB activator)